MGSDLPLCVIGAGPAGATAARMLAERGCRCVKLFEKKSWPRPKTCAGGLGPRARQWLSRRGMLAAVENSSVKIRSLRFTAPSGKSARLVSPADMALVLPRDRFDALLVERAVRAGVDFRPSTRVLSIEPAKNGAVVATSAGDIEAAAVVVAAGALDGLSPQHPAPKNMVASIMARYADFPHNPSEMEMIYSPRLLPYYAWLFPEPDGCVNIGFMAMNRGSATSLHETFDYILDRYFSSRLGQARQAGGRRGAPLRCGGAIGRVVDGCVLRAGESAGLVNCTTGEGIAYALESGELAAAAIAEAIAGPRVSAEALAGYGRSLRRRFAATLRVSALFRSFAAGPVFPAAAGIGTLPLFQKLSAFVLAKV